jgi:hypothetical protein
MPRVRYAVAVGVKRGPGNEMYLVRAHDTYGAHVHHASTVDFTLVNWLNRRLVGFSTGHL